MKCSIDMLVCRRTTRCKFSQSSLCQVQQVLLRYLMKEELWFLKAHSPKMWMVSVVLQDLNLALKIQGRHFKKKLWNIMANEQDGKGCALVQSKTCLWNNVLWQYKPFTIHWTYWGLGKPETEVLLLQFVGKLIKSSPIWKPRHRKTCHWLQSH